MPSVLGKMFLLCAGAPRFIGGTASPPPPDAKLPRPLAPPRELASVPESVSLATAATAIIFALSLYGGELRGLESIAAFTSLPRRRHKLFSPPAFAPSYADRLRATLSGFRNFSNTITALAHLDHGTDAPLPRAIAAPRRLRASTPIFAKSTTLSSRFGAFTGRPPRYLLRPPLRRRHQFHRHQPHRSPPVPLHAATEHQRLRTRSRRLLGQRLRRRECHDQ